MRSYYLCTDSIAANTQAGIYRVDDTEVHRINPSISLRVSSIDYYGTVQEGKLLAGEVLADINLASVQVWRTENALSNAPVWDDASRPPTGGSNPSGFANAQIKWSPEGEYAYCGTSSAPVDFGGLPNWPFCYLTGALLDESAFSISPCSPEYAMKVGLADKPLDFEIGDIWNQIGLIDTEITLLSDVNAIQSQNKNDYDVLYLSSLNTNGMVVRNFDSIWRSTSDTPGTHWERILCMTTSNNGILLRGNPRTHTEDTNIGNRSNTIVAGDRGTRSIYYSNNEGSEWHDASMMSVPANVQVADLTISNEAKIHLSLIHI